MAKTPTVAVIAAKAQKSKVWHIQEPRMADYARTICGESTNPAWTAQCELDAGERVCKHCLRRLEAALGGRYRITDIGD